MLTAWGKRIAAIQRLSGTPLPNVSVSSGSNAFIEAKTVAGNVFYISPVYASGAIWNLISDAFVETGSSSSTGVAFGSGGAEVTENDYTLGSQITGLSGSVSSISTVFDAETNKYVARLTYTISNDTGAEVTIREIGLFARFCPTDTRGAAPNTSQSYRRSFMLDRTLLDTPVTIANGAAGVVRYDFAY